MYNSYYPYQMNYNNQFQQQPSYNSLLQQNNTAGKQEVVRVNGKNGAQAFQLPPNSSILLLDETAPIVWLKTTDGAGYPTITPYDINPHQTETSQQKFDIDIKPLQERISKLEEIVKDVQLQFAESDAGSSQPVKRIITTTTK